MHYEYETQNKNDDHLFWYTEYNNSHNILLLLFISSSFFLLYIVKWHSKTPINAKCFNHIPNSWGTVQVVGLFSVLPPIYPNRILITQLQRLFWNCKQWQVSLEKNPHVLILIHFGCCKTTLEISEKSQMLLPPLLIWCWSCNCLNHGYHMMIHQLYIHEFIMYYSSVFSYTLSGWLPWNQLQLLVPLSSGSKWPSAFIKELRVFSL